jgi:hypothetical protein
MANSKISALTAATTPVAGTEVLPIVQSSTTKQVSIANLTAGRSVSAADYVMSTGNLVPSTAAKGVDFTANTPASGMTSQLLNWYEEGSGTPTRNGFTEVLGAGSITATYYYTRIGRVVNINITLICAGGATIAAAAGGAAYFTALPFASARYAIGNWLDTTGLVLTGAVGVISTAMFVGGAGFAATSNAHSFTATYNV